MKTTDSEQAHTECRRLNLFNLGTQPSPDRGVTAQHMIIFHIMLLAWDGYLSLETKKAHGVANEIVMKLTSS